MPAFAVIGGSTATGPSSGGWTFAYNGIGTTPQQVVAADPQIRSITFCNPGTIDIYVAPLTVQNSGSDAALTPSLTALGGCFKVPAGGGILTFDGECQKGWQALAASGTTNPLTVKVSRT